MAVIVSPQGSLEEKKTRTFLVFVCLIFFFFFVGLCVFVSVECVCAGTEYVRTCL